MAAGPVSERYEVLVVGGGQAGVASFRHDHSWIDVPVFDDDGRVVHQRRVTASPGLYFLGLPWQHTRGSALLGWVKDDAEYLAQQIATFPHSEPALASAA